MLWRFLVYEGDRMVRGSGYDDTWPKALSTWFQVFERHAGRGMEIVCTWV